MDIASWIGPLVGFFERQLLGRDERAANARDEQARILRDFARTIRRAAIALDNGEQPMEQCAQLSTWYRSREAERVLDGNEDVDEVYRLLEEAVAGRRFLSAIVAQDGRLETQATAQLKLAAASLEALASLLGTSGEA